MVRWLRFCALNAGARFDLWLANTRDSQVLFSDPVISDSLQPMDCNTPGLHVPYHLPEFAQVHAHFIGDALQPSQPLFPFSSCPLSFPASGSFPMSQLFVSGGQKYWNFSFSISPSNEYSGLISFRIDWLDLFAVQGTFRSPL